MSGGLSVSRDNGAGYYDHCVDGLRGKKYVQRLCTAGNSEMSVSEGVLKTSAMLTEFLYVVNYT